MPNKYGAKKTTIDGIKFDSLKEARRYTELRLLERAGKILDLQCQVGYSLVVNGHKIGRYTADFVYWDSGIRKEVVEDVKSPATKKARDYVLRKKLMLAIHGIEIRET
jgi:Protein of unknown function (DUF1064)